MKHLPFHLPQDWRTQPQVFFKWLLFACITGLAVGSVSAAFYFCFHIATELRTEHPGLLFLLPAAGAAIVLLYRVCGMKEDRGTNLVLAAARDNVPLPLRTAPLVFCSTILTHLTGGSSGREGAILQIGGSIAARLGRWIHLDDWDNEVITMCGMAAAFSALFGTPLTAAVFAAEVASSGALCYAALLPCTLSALVGIWVAQCFGVPGTAFSLTGIADLTPITLLQVTVLGVLFALLAVLFCHAMHLSHHLYERYLPNPVLRAVVGGGLVVGLTFLVWLWNPGTYDYNGAGEAILHAAAAGHARPEAFLLKLLFTALTLGAGFKGGEIVPVFFTGATFGCIAAPLVGLHPSFGAGLGMVSLFSGVTNCPVASLLLALELFAADSPGLLTGQSLGLFAVCIAVSYLLSGFCGLYSEQIIVYSKLSRERIDRHAD